MATAAAVLYPHISKKAGVCGGKACIDGTRIRVMDIVALHHQGCAVDEMVDYFESRPLTPAEIYSALAYFHDHKDEIESSFAEEASVEARHEGRKAEYLKRRTGQ